MIIIDYKGTEIKLENEKWICKDKVLKGMLKTYDYESLENYSPFRDLSLAELFIKEIGGEITKVTNPPGYVKGRVY